MEVSNPVKGDHVRSFVSTLGVVIDVSDSTAIVLAEVTLAIEFLSNYKLDVDIQVTRPIAPVQEQREVVL